MKSLQLIIVTKKEGKPIKRREPYPFPESSSPGFIHNTEKKYYEELTFTQIYIAKKTFPIALPCLALLMTCF